MSILKVENLNVCYQVKGQWIPALREFSLDVQQGEIHGVVGESGSGKSTLAAALMSYLSPNGRIEKGSHIELESEDLLAKTPAQLRQIWGKRMKLVPQNAAAALNPSMKVGEQIAEQMRLHFGMNRHQAQEAVLEMLRKVQLLDTEQLIKRYPHELSGGMQQRILIAMALITKPALLILDEPTTGLDVTTEAVILDLIRELIADHQGGVIYITHDLGVVAQLCDRVSIMYGGELMGTGTVPEVFANPIHPYTIGLLKSIPRLGQSKFDSALPSIEGHPPSLMELPTACVFANRCPLAIDKCTAQKPVLEKTADGRLIRCHRWQEIAAGDLNLLEDSHIGVMPPHGDTETLLNITELSKFFPVPRSLSEILSRQSPVPIRAVDGISLGIQKGRTLGLVGESGSGKTTLSRVIMGLEERSSGSINLEGIEVYNHARERTENVLAKMQMIFQNPQQSLNPYLTIAQALRRPLMKLRKMSRQAADAEVPKLLEAVNLRAEYKDRYPSELSGGEKQRVAIARAFASDPDIIIADEPVSALDVSVQSAVLNLLARLQADNETAYLFISHDLAVVGYLADYVAVMYLGQLFEVGYAKDLFAPPYHPYTEALISAIPDPNPQQKGTRILLKGEIPSARHLPNGCRFHTRCPHKIGAICETEAPPWQDSGEGHFIRCHIPPNELNALQGGQI